MSRREADIATLVDAAKRVVQAADAMAPLDRAKDKAFIWEADPKPLLTFGDIKALRAALANAEAARG